MGDCLPECPTGAIRVVERDAAAYDAEAVEKKCFASSSLDKSNIPDILTKI